jgi:hypothetical protein
MNTTWMISTSKQPVLAHPARRRDRLRYALCISSFVAENRQARGAAEVHLKKICGSRGFRPICVRNEHMPVLAGMC